MPKFHVDWFVEQEGYERLGVIVEAKDEAEARRIAMRYVKEQWPLPKGMEEEPEIFDSSTESFFERIKPEDIHVARSLSAERKPSGNPGHGKGWHGERARHSAAAKKGKR